MVRCTIFMNYEKKNCKQPYFPRKSVNFIENNLTTEGPLFLFTVAISVARKFKSICRKLALFEFALPSSTCKLAS